MKKKLKPRKTFFYDNLYNISEDGRTLHDKALKVLKPLFEEYAKKGYHEIEICSILENVPRLIQFSYQVKK